MSTEEQHARAARFIANQPDAEVFRDMLGLTEQPAVKSSYTGSKAVPSNRRTASRRSVS